jgi:hypothetical protein
VAADANVYLGGVEVGGLGVGLADVRRVGQDHVGEEHAGEPQQAGSGRSVAIFHQSRSFRPPAPESRAMT